MREWITGRNPVFETLQARRRQVFRLWVARGVEQGGRLGEVIRMAPARKLRVEEVPRQQLDTLGEGHQGVALEASAYPYAAMQDILQVSVERNEPLFVLVLDVIQNPQNLGTLVRSAEALGVHGILLPLARAAGVTPAVVHASAGASEHMLVAQVNLAQGLEVLKEAGAWVVGLEGSQDATPIEGVRLDGALALVVGSEGEGMRSLVRRSCDVLARLPTCGRVGSLNAAVAGSIALYHAFEARRKSAPKPV